MLNIGPMELMVILLVALIVVGPQRLPEVGRSVAKALRELRRQTDEVRSSFEATINADLDEPDEPEQAGAEAGSSADPGAPPAGEEAEPPGPEGPAALTAGIPDEATKPDTGDAAAGGVG